MCFRLLVLGLSSTNWVSRADDGVRQLVEQSEGEVSPADKTAAMKSAVEKRVVALRMKMGKLIAVSNPELTDGWLREVRIVNLFLFNL